MSEDQPDQPDDDVRGVGLTAPLVVVDGVPRTGYSKLLRDRLRATRERKGLKQPEVAAAIVELVNQRRGEAGPRFTLTPGGLSHYEVFRRHPPIDVMAAWARVLGLRLIVDLDDAESGRVPVLVRPRAARLARILDSGDEQRVAAVEAIINYVFGVEPDE